MTHEERTAIYREKSKIVSLYILYLKGKIDGFDHSRRELLKALQAVLIAANKHQKYLEYKHYKHLEDQAIEKLHVEEDGNFENRHLLRD